MSIVAQRCTALPPIPPFLRATAPLPAPTLVVGRVRIHEAASGIDHLTIPIDARDVRSPESSATRAHYEAWLSVWVSLPDLLAHADRLFDLVLEQARWDTAQMPRADLDYVPRIRIQGLTLGRLGGYVMQFLHRVPQR